MSRYTSGPWEMQASGNITGALGELIAFVSFPERLVSIANGRLMAAAPEMAAALQPIAAAYPDDPGTSDLDNEQPVTITLGDVRRVWRALGKAGAR